MLIYCVLISAVLVAIVSAAYQFGVGKGGLTAGFLAFGGFLLFCMMPPVLWGNLLAMTIVAIGCRAAKSSPGVFFAWSAGATSLVYLIAALSFVPTYREHKALAAEYPVESLAPRLAYEAASKASATAATAHRIEETGVGPQSAVKRDAALGNRSQFQNRSW